MSHRANKKIFGGTAKKEHATTTKTLSPSKKQSPSPFEITEIVMHIFSFLDQYTLLTVAAHVCTLWFCIARPLLRHHLQLRSVGSKAYKCFRKRLLQADSLFVGLKFGPWKHSTFGYESKLWNQLAMPLVCRSLKTSIYERLQELSMDMPLGAKSAPLELILTQCPRLLSLSLGCLQGSLQERRNRFPHVLHPPTVGSLHQNNHLKQPLPLRLLFLSSVRLSPKAFLSYMPFLRHLTDLSLLDIRDSWHPQALVTAAMNATTAAALLLHLADTAANPEQESALLLPHASFWTVVGRQCPELERICFNCRDAMTTGGYATVPMELFPSVTAWGVDYRCIDASNPSWRALTLRAVENRLTSLEILPGNPTAGFQPLAGDRDRDNLLWRLLRESPSLEHFKAGHIPMSTEVLWGNRAHAGDGTFRASAANVWRCRRLKTLTLNLNSGSEDLTVAENNIVTRRIFGYLGRVCPQLEDLTLVVPCRLYAMESGLCLLTRLKDLRRLAIYTSIPDYYTSFEKSQRQDFVWMQGIAYHRGSVTAYEQQLVSPAQVGLRCRRVSAYEDYKLCVEKVRTWSTTFPDAGSFAPGTPSQVEERRRKMQQQQASNEYLSSFEDPESPISPEALSKVDGLVDMEFCGSFLDMEALLLARLDRFQKEANKWEDISGQWKDAAPGPEGAQPWPRLERILLSNGSLEREGLKSVQSQAALAQKAMGALRPDINIICQHSESPHLLIDI
ncbi:hypothetical protein EMPS_07180 [Entomortierella parvispora]|uniref:F-box domain-containing protein n=1 Tax=Entomortierella parvispora TaxID=205924 RepID=A0A9P3HEE5_9FUNG|nr:hypothetical protein EMPS_07180 [Entomortierella parvispora]